MIHDTGEAGTLLTGWEIETILRAMACGLPYEWYVSKKEANRRRDLRRKLRICQMDAGESLYFSEHELSPTYHVRIGLAAQAEANALRHDELQVVWRRQVLHCGRCGTRHVMTTPPGSSGRVWERVLYCGRCLDKRGGRWLPGSGAVLSKRVEVPEQDHF
ncbi:MAG: hypothetical protein GY769_08070 [bacterium]|nr:hypothetical protein [bacterium]